MSKIDNQFFERADKLISLANKQIDKETTPGKVSASFMYAVARFNSWLSAQGFKDSNEMKESREETLNYFVAEYRKMLEDNLDDYIDNFDDYFTD